MGTARVRGGDEDLNSENPDPRGKVNLPLPRCPHHFLQSLNVKSGLINLAVATAPAGTEPQKIANWDVAAQKLRSSIIAVREGAQEVREDVREATR